MSVSRWLRPVVGCLLLLGVIAVGEVDRGDPAEAQQATDEVRDPVWWALGDSYSSGEGIVGVDNGDDGKGQGGRDCQRASGHAVDDRSDPPRLIENDAKAWAVVGYEETFGIDSRRDNLTLVACTGTLTDDWEWQADEAARRSGVSQPDVVSLSMGGNNLNFAGILVNCIDLGVVAAEDKPGGGFGCDHSEDELRARVDAVVGRSDAAMARGTLPFPDMLRGLAGRVRRGGHVIVAGYPQLLEEVGRWGRLEQFIGCESFESGDVGMLRSVFGYFNQQLALAAQAANDNDRDVTFHFFDVSRVYENESGRHGLCSADSWFNGLDLGWVGEGGFRKERSFHPNKAGHRGTGVALYQLITSDIGADSLTAPAGDLTADALRSVWIPELCGHHAGALVDGSLTDVPENEGGVVIADFNDDAVAFGELDGRPGGDAAMAMECSQGGVGLPMPVLAYASDGSHLATLYAADFFDQAGIRDVVYSVAIEDGLLHIRWGGPMLGDTLCCGTLSMEGWFRIDDREVVVDRLASLSAEDVARQVLDALNGGDTATFERLVEPEARRAFISARDEGGPLTLATCSRPADLRRLEAGSVSCGAHTPDGITVIFDQKILDWWEWTTFAADYYYPETGF